MAGFSCFGEIPAWYQDLQDRYGSTGECPAGKRVFWIGVVIPYQTIDVKVYLGEDEIVYDEHDRVFKDARTGKWLKDVYGRCAVKDSDGSMIFR